MAEAGPRRWAELRRHFDELVEVADAERAERLAALGAHDPALQASLEKLLAIDASPGERLERIEALFGFAGPGIDPDPLAADPLELVGRTVAHFRVVAPLASGGMGVVYRADDLELHRTVALKFPLPEQRLDGGAKARFLREARAAGGLDHPNICHIHEAGETTAGHLFLAMSFYEGETLRSRIARADPLPVAEACRIAAQIASGLSAAHGRGITHGDLKPANVMILPDGTVKVLDFGLARAKGAPAPGTAVTLGTVAYMAPEQIRGEPADARADLWALGVVCYEMLTGQRPFGGEREHDVARAIVHDESTPPSTVRSDVDADLDALVLTLLRKDPAQRPASADAVVSSLAAIAAPAVGAAGSPLVPVRAWGRRRLLTGLTALAFAGAAVIAGVRFFGGPAAPAVRSDAIMVLPFRISAQSRHADLGEGMADLLSLRFTGDPGPEAIDMRSTLRALRTGQVAVSSLTPASALGIARDAGAAHVLLGEIIEASGRLVVSAAVHGPDGSRTATVSGAPDSLLSLADRLAAQLLSRAAGEDELRLAMLTSASLPAVRAYLNGQASYRRGEFEKAVESFRTALDHDSSFALAALGAELAVGWGQPEAQQTWGKRLVMQYRDRLPPRDRALVEALYVHADALPRERLRMFDDYVKRYPDRVEGWVGLAEVLFHSGAAIGMTNPDELTLGALRRAIELQPEHAAAYLHIIDILAFREDTAALRRASEDFRAILSESSVATSAATATLWLAAMVLDDQPRLAAIRAGMDSLPAHALTSLPLYALRSGVDPADAERALDIAERRASSAAELLEALLVRARLYQSTGRPTQARLVLERRARTLEEPGRSWTSLTRLAYPDADTTGAGVAVERYHALALAGAPLEDGRRHCVLGLIEHHRGERIDAEHGSALRRLAQNGEYPTLLACAHALEAAAAHASSAPDAGYRLAALDSVLEHAAVDIGSMNGWVRYLSVQLHRERGEPEAALRAANRICVGCFLHAPAVLERARLQALLGDRAAAIHNYRFFLRLMARPEPGPAAELAAAARRELLELGAR